MPERLEELEHRLEQLTSRVEALERSLLVARGGAQVEGAAQAAASAAGSPSPPAGPCGDAAALDRPAQPREDDWAISSRVEELVERHGLVVLAGVVSLVLAGAMVLRLLTVNTQFPLAVGAGLGLAYCASLLLLAAYKLRHAARLHGDTHFVLAVLILDTLLVEVASRPGGFSHALTLILLVASLIVFCALAIRYGRVLPFLIALLAAPVAAIASMSSPFLHVHFAGVLAVATLAARHGMRRHEWRAPRWVPGLMSLVYLLALMTIAYAAARRDMPQHEFARPAVALMLFAAFFAVYVLHAAYVALYRYRRLDGFETTMALGTAILTYIGAAVVLVAFDGGRILCGGVGGALALLFYGIAALSYAYHRTESGSFLPLNAIAFGYALASFALTFGANATLGISYQVLGFFLALFAARYRTRSIFLQAQALALLAFIVLFATALRTSPPQAGESIGGAAYLIASGILTIGMFLLLRRSAQGEPGFNLRSLDADALLREIVLAMGVLELLAGIAPYAFVLSSRLLGITAATAHEDALWQTVHTLAILSAALVTLTLGVRLRSNGATFLAVGLMGLGTLKLFLVDAMHVPVRFLICSSAIFGITMLCSSYVYRRYRGLGRRRP